MSATYIPRANGRNGEPVLIFLSHVACARTDGKRPSDRMRHEGVSRDVAVLLRVLFPIVVNKNCYVEKQGKQWTDEVPASSCSFFFLYVCATVIGGNIVVVNFAWKY